MAEIRPIENLDEKTLTHVILQSRSETFQVFTKYDDNTTGLQ